VNFRDLLFSEGWDALVHEQKSSFEHASLLILLSSFFGFYFTVEYLFLGGKAALNIEDILVFSLLSFLNLIPAGLFAFAVVSLLPARWRSNYDEEHLLKNFPVGRPPRVAVVYTTYNDFLSEYARYDCEEAQRNGLPFFILDDSTDSKEREKIDEFALLHRCQVVRRENRKGFKAGAINHWIKRFGVEFDYFFLLDSDSQASYESIAHCIEVARRDPEIALVQSKTLCTTSNRTKLTSSTVSIQHAYMETVQRAMKNLGSSPFYGHNALISVSAIKSIGGFVEESNEDYKTLARLHRRGYRSIYAEQAITWEETPPDYFSMRKRSLRWARDAVSQLLLLSSKSPPSICFYLFYGWAGYISNLVLLAFITALAFGSLSIDLFNVGLLGEAAGLATISVIVSWPLLALRFRDPELTPRRIASAIMWGSIYNIPMAAPNSIQILMTSFSLMKKKVKTNLFGKKGFPPEEFIVTPKVREAFLDLQSIIRKLWKEILVESFPIAIAFSARVSWGLIWGLPQMISIIVLPLVIFKEFNGRTISKRVTAEEPLSPLITPRLGTYRLASVSAIDTSWPYLIARSFNH
jgi:hypothetical protein